MARENFHQQLDNLKEQLLTMAHQVQRSFGDAIDAFLTGDTVLRHRVFEAEAAVNAQEREVDRLAIELLAMEQPTAVDLRFILSIMRINSDLERIGDQAVNIAERARGVEPAQVNSLPVDIRQLAAHANEMLTVAMRSFTNSDAELADTVLHMDDQVDAMNAHAFTLLSQVIAGEPGLAPAALNTLIVARNIERVGDHATNVAEDVIFWRRGDDVRHAQTPTQS